MEIKYLGLTLILKGNYAFESMRLKTIDFVSSRVWEEAHKDIY